MDSSDFVFPVLVIYVMTRIEVKLAFATTPAVVEEEATVSNLASAEESSV